MNRIEAIHVMMNMSHLTIQEMADLMDIGRSNFYFWRQGTSKPKKANVNKLAEILGLKLKWRTDDELDIIGKSGGKIIDSVPIAEFRVPVITQASAGIYTYPEVVQMSDTAIRVPRGIPKDAFGFEVIGDSAYPFVSDGDVCVVSPQKPYVNNKPCFVALEDGSHFIKRVDKSNGEYNLISINKEYDDIVVSPDDVLAVFPVLHTRYKV